MADAVASAGANTGATPQGAPAPVRSKISDMSSQLYHGVPATPAPLVIHQGREATPVGDVQARGNKPPPLGFDDSGNPDLGHGGDLDAEAHALARDADGMGAELDEYGNDPNQLELDDSIPSELVDPSEYADLKAKWDADDLPAEWDDKKWVEVPITNRDGSTYLKRETIGEVKRGYMRREDYSQKLGEVSVLRNNVMAAQQGQQLLMTHLSDPGQFLTAMRNLNIMHVFEAVAEHWAKEVALPEQELKMRNPQAYQQYLNNKKLQERLIAAEREKQSALQQAQQAAQQQPPQLAPDTQQIAHQLSQMMPLALKRAGIEDVKARSPMFKLIWDEPVAVAGQNMTRGEQIFGMHFANLVTTLQGPVTTQFVQDVVEATKGTVEQLSREQQPNVRRGQAPAAAPAPNPGGARTNGARQPTRAKIGDMGRMLREPGR